jgi:hypothetical protein
MIESEAEPERADALWHWLRLDDVVLLVVGAFAAVVAGDALAAGDYVVALASMAAAILSYVNASVNALERREKAHNADEEGASK